MSKQPPLTLSISPGSRDIHGQAHFLRALWLRSLFLVALSAGVGGCGASLRSSATPETVEMEVVRVTARVPEVGESNAAGPMEVDAYDARELLRRGNGALAEERYPDALVIYDRLVAEFPDSSFLSAAHYNAALSLERQGQFERAAERYMLLVRRLPESNDVKDSLFQAARCYERLERWESTVEVLDMALEREDLSPDERLEAMTRRGTALVLAGQRDQGETQLRRAILFYRREGIDAIRTDYYLAQAQHYLGEAPRMAMADIAMSNDEAEFRIALERRCALLLEAQTQYVQAIRVGNAHWGAASAYRIGEMYSGLYDDVMAVPVPEVEVPPDLTAPEEIQAFRDEFPRHYRHLLREYLEPLLHNAIRWWESNLMMVERTGVSGQWVQRTRENLSNVQRLLEEIEEEGENDDHGDDESDPSPSSPQRQPTE